MPGLYSNPLRFLKDVLDYAVVSYAKNLDHGTDEEKLVTTSEFFGNDLNNVNIENGEYLIENTPVNSPMTSIKKNVYDDYKNNEKDGFEYIVLAAHCALKSIIGRKHYFKTNNKHLLARMAGYSRHNYSIGLPEALDRYNNRYWLTKIKDCLRDSWYVRFYSLNMRGFYFSLDMSLDNLAIYAEREKKNNRRKIWQQQEKIAQRKAIQFLEPYVSNYGNN